MTAWFACVKAGVTGARFLENDGLQKTLDKTVLPRPLIRVPMPEGSASRGFQLHSRALEDSTRHLVIGGFKLRELLIDQVAAANYTV